MNDPGKMKHSNQEEQCVYEPKCVWCVVVVCV